jgi:hypothetical protein
MTDKSLHFLAYFVRIGGRPCGESGVCGQVRRSADREDSGADCLSGGVI